MIPVRETSPGVFEPIAGNPVLFRMDGKVQAPLRTILAPSWTAEDRAAFGVYVVEPSVVPAGMQAVGAPTYERRDGVVVEVRTVEAMPAPQPSRYDLLKAEVEALTARVAALEGRG